MVVNRETRNVMDRLLGRERPSKNSRLYVTREECEMAWIGDSLMLDRKVGPITETNFPPFTFYYYEVEVFG